MQSIKMEYMEGISETNYGIHSKKEITQVIIGEKSPK